MKALAKFLAGVAIVVVALLAYLILGSGLTVTMEMEIAPASMTVEAVSLMESRRINGKLTYIERFRQPAQPQQEG